VKTGFIIRILYFNETWSLSEKIKCTWLLDM
jgi:hypothetical protein